MLGGEQEEEEKEEEKKERGRERGREGGNLECERDDKNVDGEEEIRRYVEVKEVSGKEDDVWKGGREEERVM